MTETIIPVAQDVRVRRHPAGQADRDYVWHLAQEAGELTLAQDLADEWAGIREYVWIMSSRGRRMGYVILRPMYMVKLVMKPDDRDTWGEAALDSLHQGVLLTSWLRDKEWARIYRRAGFRPLDPAEQGTVYVRAAAPAS